MCVVTDQPAAIELRSAAGRKNAAFLLRVLNLMIAAGVVIGRVLVQKAETGAAPVGHCIAAQTRLDSTIRRIIMLFRAIVTPGFGAPVEPRAARKERKPRTPPDEAAKERRRERDDLRDEPDAPYDVTGKTLDGLINEICADLGMPALGAQGWRTMTRQKLAKLVSDAVALMLAEAAAEAAGPKRRRKLYWGTRSWLAARAKAARRLEPRVRDG
jgi:hypothetical protein